MSKEANGMRTWVEVDRRAVAKNVAAFRRLIAPTVQLIGVVKSNAYGHNLVEFSKLLVAQGVERLAVDSIVEARALRAAGLAVSLLVLGYTLPENYAEARALDVALTVSAPEQLALAQKAGVKFHLKIDTGMHRQGFAPAELLASSFQLSKNLFEGVYTHFAAAKNPAFPAGTKKQIAEFEIVLAKIKKAGYKPLVHAAATAGTIIFPQAHYDAVRIGIGLYGLWPSDETRAAYESQLALTPALAWRTVIGEIKNVPAGARVGYDLTETLARPTRLAIAPVGYWHGLPRALSSIGRALVGGRAAKVVGRVSMDMIALDITDCPKAKVGSVVTLLGTDGHASVAADELALLAGTSSYEIVTRLNPLMKRIYK